MLDQLKTMLPGFRVYTVPYEGGIEYHAQLPGNPLYTEQSVGVDTDGSLGWSGEQECGDELWIAIHTLLGRDLPAKTQPIRVEVWFGGRWVTETPYRRRAAVRRSRLAVRKVRARDMVHIAPLANSVHRHFRPVRVPAGWSLRQVRSAELRELCRSTPCRKRNLPLQVANPSLYCGGGRPSLSSRIYRG